MSPDVAGKFFPANPDIANILGRPDLHSNFRRFSVWGFWEGFSSLRFSGQLGAPRFPLDVSWRDVLDITRTLPHEVGTLGYSNAWL